MIFYVFTCFFFTLYKYKYVSTGEDDKTMNNFKTVSQFPPIETIPQNKIKSTNIAETYGYLLLTYHSPPRPLILVFSDLTPYRDQLVLIRDAPLAPEVVSKLDLNSLFSVTLNQVQCSKLQGQLQDVFQKEFDLQLMEQLHRMGVIVKLKFYLKNFKNLLEGMCIELDVVTQFTMQDPPQLKELLDRIKENFNVNEFHQRSPIRNYYNPSKRKIVTNILFEPVKKKNTKSSRVKDSRFDTQQILFNLNLSSGPDDDNDESLSDGGNEDEDESFISVFTSLRDLRRIPLEQGIGKIFKLNGFLIEYQRGFDEILFVEQTEMTHLNESNSLILKTDDPDQLTKGKRLEISVVKQVVSIGLIELVEFKIV